MYRRLENATKCLTGAVIEHEHSQLSHQFLPSGSENYVCIREGLSLSWGSLELCRVWQVRYEVCSEHTPSSHPEQGMAASCVSLTLLLLWAPGPLGFAYHCLLSSCCISKLVLYFCPKSRVKWNMYHLWAEFLAVIFKNNGMTESFHFFAFSRVLHYVPHRWSLVVSFHWEFFSAVLPRFPPPLSLSSIKTYIHESNQ